MNAKFHRPPSAMDRREFVERFANVYEHSPWIAEAVWDGGLKSAYDERDGLASAMRAVLDGAGEAEKRALIRAHPDLAGTAAVRGELTENSTSEQAGAGLDQCTEGELARFQTLNAIYMGRFGFPFILAVTGKTRHDILNAFEARIENTPEAEFRTAMEQIHQIAQQRLKAL